LRDARRLSRRGEEGVRRHQVAVRGVPERAEKSVRGTGRARPEKSVERRVPRDRQTREVSAKNLLRRPPLLCDPRRADDAHAGAPWHAASLRDGRYGGSSAPGQTSDGRSVYPPHDAEKKIDAGAPPCNVSSSTRPAVASAARSVAATAVRSTWQWVWSQRSK